MAKKSIEDQIALMAAKMGVVIPDLKRSEEVSREADAVILYLENPKGFAQKECRQCSRLFAANYSAVAMCSDYCRIEWLGNMGIEWNPMKSQDERWAGRIPLIVSPVALALAESVLAQD